MSRPRWWDEYVDDALSSVLVDDAPTHTQEEPLPDISDLMPTYDPIPFPGEQNLRTPLHGHGSAKYAPNDQQKKDHRLPSYQKKTVQVKPYRRDGEIVVRHKRRTKLKN